MSESQPDPEKAYFDFLTYLAKVDPSQQYEITTLTGGLVNLVVRATKIGVVHRGNPTRFEGHDTLILKYAPPFVASVGAAAPFSTKRQLIEGRALNLLASTPEILAAQTASRTSIPQVIFADEMNHILIITDLGSDLLTLDQWLVPALSPALSQSSRTPPSAAICMDVGRRVGHLLAAVHAMDVSKTVLEGFRNEDADKLIRCEVVDKMSGILEQFAVSGDDGVRERRRLCATIEAEFEERYLRSTDALPKGVFSVGDLWTGAVLVSPDGETVGLVDWEFAGERKPLQDIAQFGAHIRLLAMSTPSPSAAHSSIISFTSELQSSYRTHLRAANPTWLRDLTARDAAMVSAWILHGREMLYNAAERYSTPSDTEKQKEMVECAVGYVIQAIEFDGNIDGGDEQFLSVLCFGP